MRQNILEAVARRTERAMEEGDNPTYEDPRDVIDHAPPKPARRRNFPAATSPRQRDSKATMKDQKRKLTKKYESLITTLMDRCEENVVMISEKDSLIAKLKEKLKTVLEYNKLFADENDQLRSQYTTLVKYVEECKSAIKEERERNRELELKKKDLEERVQKFELPDRETCGIPLVEVCMSCSSRQILLGQAREQNTRLQNDMLALKDVLYRLNVQLSRYQEKLRSLPTPDGASRPVPRPDTLDSLINASLTYSGSKALDTGYTDDGQSNRVHPEESPAAKTVDLSGLLSAQALAPLFDAYQENLQEKDSLIIDYEKQFEIINKKSKQIVTENKGLIEKVTAIEQELAQARQGYRKVTVEKETADIEKTTLAERAERAESKLKEVYELYEDKMAAMMRDYETVHREYMSARAQLEAAHGKAARTVPADLHERRLDHCKRLLEELKHQYSMEAERKATELGKLQQQAQLAEDTLAERGRELEAALKNVRLYRKAAVIFRQRLRRAQARLTRGSRRKHDPEPLRRALAALTDIKREIKVVKSRAYSSLEELEHRIVEQERRAARAQAAHRRELERARLALRHKEDIIRSLIDKVADVEEVRLSQTNAYRLQGIVSDSSPEKSPSHHRTPPSPRHTPPSTPANNPERDARKKGKG